MFISLVGIRGRLIELVPKHIMLATAVGIGLFLAHIGFQQAEGLGLITFDPATLVTMGEWGNRGGSVGKRGWGGGGRDEELGQGAGLQG